MTTPPRRLISAEKRPEDEAALRPQVLADFTGQEAARKNLKVFIESAKSRGEALDHVLLFGPPGGPPGGPRADRAGTAPARPIKAGDELSISDCGGR